MSEGVPQQANSLNEYIETEFLFYMFPCYYAIVAFLYRYFTLLETDKKYYVNSIFLEGVFSSILEHDQSTEQNHLPYKKLTPSFLIKYKVSLWNSFLYLVMIVLSFFTSDELFYGAKHHLHSLLYVFGAIAWYLSGFVIKKEFERDVNQSLWTHRFFWMFTGVFSVTKMFEDYFLPINIIVNSMFLIINLQLLVYGLYRPQDNQTVEMIRSPEIPSFVKSFFSTLQLNGYIRGMFGIEDYARQSFADGEWLKEELNEENLDEERMREIEATFSAKKQTAQNIKEEINLMNTLPRRNIFVDKKLRYVKQNDKYKPYYFILTQIGDARFQTQRKLKDFTNLDNSLQEVFNSRYFPKSQAPKIAQMAKKYKSQNTQGNSVEEVGDEFSGKAEVLEEWLQEVIKEPLFMIKPVLEFLSVDQERSAPFITYYEFSHKSFCTKTFLISKLTQQKSKQEQIRRSLVGYYQVEDKQTAQETQSIKKMIRAKLQFKVTVNFEISEQKEYGFWVQCETVEKGRMKWMLRKYEENILQLNQRIEDECKLSISFYYQILSSVTIVSHKAKAEAFREYLQKLLQTDNYYCVSLFQFIRFDPIKLEPKLLNTEMSFSQGSLFDQAQQQKRDSRYFQMWEDKGSFIEVLRIDKLTPQSMDIPVHNELTEPIAENEYRFIVKRKGATFRNKKTSELQTLRLKLYSLYKGINHVPILDLKDCNKQQMKNRIQNFLLKIESLPKIQINKNYKNFYQNSL